MGREDGEGEQPLSVEDEERRLAAVLVGDVVGYTRLVAEHEEQTARTLRAYRDEVELLVRQHRGRLVDFTGDSFLAEFASALYAARCAVDIQGVLRGRNAQLPEERRVEFRIGAHLGDVLVEGERLIGPGVNVAARLETLATPGGICVSEKLRDELQGRVQLGYRDLGLQTLHNVPGPVRAYSIELPETTPEPKPRRRRPSWQLAFAAGAVLAIMAVGLWFSRQSRGPEPLHQSPARSIRSLAVLPLESPSPGAELRAIALGLTDELIGELSRRSTLRIASLRSVMFVDKARPAQEIARELGVDAIVEGTYLESGERVRVTTNLIDARSDRHLWSERFEEDRGDLIGLVRTISEAAASGIQQELSPRKPLQAAGPEAQRSYLRGRYALGLLTQASLPHALELFQDAIQQDPSFARAHAAWALAYVYHEMSFGLRAPHQYFPAARMAARRALALDGGVAEAHTALGLIHFFYDWNWLAAEQEFERSLDLGASDPLLNGSYPVYLATMGRKTEALAVAERAVEHSVGDPLVRVTLMSVLAASGDVAGTLEMAEALAEEYPHLVHPLNMIGHGAAASGDLGRAHLAFMKKLRLRIPTLGLSPEEEAALLQKGEEAYATGGWEKWVRWYLDETIIEEDEHGERAIFLFLMGQREEALGELERAFTARDPVMVNLRSPVFFSTDVQEEPRFQDHIARLGLPPLPDAGP